MGKVVLGVLGIAWLTASLVLGAIAAWFAFGERQKITNLETLVLVLAMFGAMMLVFVAPKVFWTAWQKSKSRPKMPPLTTPAERRRLVVWYIPFVVVGYLLLVLLPVELRVRERKGQREQAQ